MVTKSDKSSLEHEKLRKELKEVKDNVEHLAEDMDRKSENAKEEMKQKAQKAGASVKHWYESQKERADELRHDAEKQISQHPFTSTALAFAAGALVASILRRR